MIKPAASLQRRALHGSQSTHDCMMMSAGAVHAHLMNQVLSTLDAFRLQSLCVCHGVCVVARLTQFNQL